MHHLHIGQHLRIKQHPCIRKFHADTEQIISCSYNNYLFARSWSLNLQFTLPNIVMTMLAFPLWPRASVTLHM